MLTQSYDNFELIIVDDGSTDDTGAVVQHTEDARIRYFKKENEERNIARNFGISHSQGDYVCFLDSDDYLLSQHFQTAADVIQRFNHPEVFHLGYQSVDEEGGILHKTNNLSTDVSLTLIKENVLSCNAIFLRHDIALSYQFIPSREVVISEDWYVWLRLASRFPIHIDNTVTSVIVEHKQRSLREIDPNKLIRATETIIDHLQRDFEFANKYGKQTDYFYANKYTLITLVLSLLKNRKMEVIRYLVKAFRYDWKVIGRKRFLASIKHMF